MMNVLRRFLMAAFFCAAAIGQDKASSGTNPVTGAPFGTAGSTSRVSRFGGTNLSPAARFQQSAQSLSANQRTKLAEINKVYTDSATPLYARLSTARKELENAVNQDKIDEGSVRAKAKEIADLETDIALARARRYSEFRAFLSPEMARRYNQAVPLARSFQPALHEGQTATNVSPSQVK